MTSSCVRSSPHRACSATRHRCQCSIPDEVAPASASSGRAMDDRPWGGSSPPAAAYVFADGRSTEEIAGQLKGFKGKW